MRILFIAPRLPLPADTGGKIRTFNILKQLASRADVHLACISSGESRSQKEISIASGVTEVTIRNRCAGLRQLLKDEQ